MTVLFLLVLAVGSVAAVVERLRRGRVVPERVLRSTALAPERDLLRREDVVDGRLVGAEGVEPPTSSL